MTAAYGTASGLHRLTVCPQWRTGTVRPATRRQRRARSDSSGQSLESTA